MSTRRLVDLAADLGLAALGLGAAASFSLLFDGWEFMGALAPLVLLAWALAVLLRRLRVGAGASLAAHLAVGVVVLSARFAPDAHWFGLPTGETLHTLSSQIDDAFSQFARIVAPVPVHDGFLIVIAGGLWVFGFFADSAAMRYRGTVQAVTPHCAVFLTAAILGRPQDRLAATLLFTAGMVAYAVPQVARGSERGRWMGGERWLARGVGSITARAAVIGIAALTIGFVATPLLPNGASTDSLIDLRRVGRGAGPRTVVSPFVGMGSLLGERSDDILFTVDADAASYWRLTALEEYDAQRQIWVSSARFRGADGTLPRSSSSEVPGEMIRQQVRVSGLGGPWMPGAYVPTHLRSSAPMSFDPRSASLILGDETPDTLVYQLDSTAPDFSRLVGTPTPAGSAEDVDPVHLEVPDLHPTVRDAVAAATAGALSDYERMVALQTWFRSRFAYDEQVDYSDSDDPLLAFLRERRGFCQQFSSAFAVMARALGFPSRIAVGFTVGDSVSVADGDDPLPAGRTRYVVRGRHAHAWPEVYFAGIGWVPFEPTPQRGDPRASAHTGVAPAQAPAPEGQDATTTTLSPTSTTEAGGTESPLDPDVDVDARAAEPDAAEMSPDSDRGGWWRRAALLALVLGVAAAAVVALRRRAGRAPRAERRSHPDRLAVARAWDRALSALERRSLVPAASETPSEFARRVAGVLDDPGSPLPNAVGELAAMETAARFREMPPTGDEIERALTLADAIAREAGRPGTLQSSSS